MRIQNPILQKSLEQGSVTKSKKDDGDFGNLLMDALKDVNGAMQNSKQAQDALLAGQPGVEIHDVMIMAEKANLAMQLTMAVRNKALEAYQELSRMQV
jgi:flagellar hook-basal body complex protein FliE